MVISCVCFSTGVNPKKIKNSAKLHKKWLFYNKLDCLLIRKIPTCITKALAYHSKKEYNILQVL